jgi:glycopeptide antibiotics resistance protein
MEPCKPSKLKIFLTTVYAALIMGSSLVPMHQDAQAFRFLLGLQPAIQNLLHIPAFAILSILCLQLLSYSPMSRARKIVLVLGFSFSFGIMNELVQAAIPGRYPGILDIVLNFLGSLMGIGFYMIAERRHSGLIRRFICG